jgi:AraC-like DNA-binding protein
MRNNQEAELLRRIRTFANRCESMNHEVLTPYTVTQNKNGITSEYGAMSDDFAEAMLKIIPYVNGLKDDQEFNVDELSRLTGKPTSELYALMADQLDKSPRMLIGRLRLQEVARLLRETNINVEDIADKCHFVSPNYLIAAFYHRYRLTPKAYRNSRAR